MIAALNYANAAYKKHQRLNSWTAKNIGKVDKVYSFSPENIDSDFYEQNKNILSEKRGNGLWLWKPYFIQKVMSELKYGDCLVYVDSGAFYVRNVRPLIDKLKSSGQDIMLFELPLIECQWTKKAVFEALNIYDEKTRFSNQTLGTIIVIVISEKSIKFINKWLQLCQKEILIFPKEKDETEDNLYIEHREDQSILSTLGKKENIIPFSDPTDRGKYLFAYLAFNRFFLKKEKEDKYSIKKTFFILNKSHNLFFYLFGIFLSRIIQGLLFVLKCVDWVGSPVKFIRKIKE